MTDELSARGPVDALDEAPETEVEPGESSFMKLTRYSSTIKMTSGPPPSLTMPSFLHGTYAQAHRKARREGRRCAEQYLKDGSLPAPRELLEVPPGQVVITEKVIDFQREHPTWRLYMVSEVKEGLYRDLDWKDASHVRDTYEAFSRDTPWGALYHAVTHVAPMDAGCIARRLKAVFRFWDSLQSARYLFGSADASLTLDELMVAACDWAMDAWCPEEDGPVRTRLEAAAERMARATKEDSIEAILRQLQRALPLARELKHRETLADPKLWRERLATLDAESFSRLSAAMTANLLEHLYIWDKQLKQE